ncbi:ninjurin-1-like [Chelonus insularis]|uniref:ninjurin-1-like n=1 Tax=Chelonus insularis TaxID=460826 RepID=UPI00158B6460|nr:ninjurin-1-like [Chelonus insularis]
MANNISTDKRNNIPLNVIEERNLNRKLLNVPSDNEELKTDMANDITDEKVLTDGKLKKASVITIDTTDKRTYRSSRLDSTYAAKKTVAQGMMDIALITANANQLRYLIEYQRNSATFWVNVVLIVVSLLLQIAVGISLIFKGRFDMQGRSHSRQARMINNYVVVGVFLITIINVFVAAFSVSPANPVVTPITPVLPVQITSPTTNTST